MKKQPKLNNPDEARLNNIIRVGLTASGMIRLFKKGSKDRLYARLHDEEIIQKISKATSKSQFRNIHANFCLWGRDNLKLAKGGRPSYGQIAKTLDVVLKVAFYYCHLSDYKKSQSICRRLNAAVDTKMMAELKKNYPEDIKWKTIEQVDKSAYTTIQEAVRKLITKEPSGLIKMPVQFDDVYWEALNRPRLNSQRR